MIRHMEVTPQAAHAPPRDTTMDSTSGDWTADATVALRRGLSTVSRPTTLNHPAPLAPLSLTRARSQVAVVTTCDVSLALLALSLDLLLLDGSPAKGLRIVP